MARSLKITYVIYKYGQYVSEGTKEELSEITGLRPKYINELSYDGKTIFIEVKNEKGQLRDGQKQFLKTMQQYDVIAGVCRSADEAVIDIDLEEVPEGYEFDHAVWEGADNE